MRDFSNLKYAEVSDHPELTRGMPGYVLAASLDRLDPQLNQHPVIRFGELATGRNHGLSCRGQPTRTGQRLEVLLAHCPIVRLAAVVVGLSEISWVRW